MIPVHDILRCTSFLLRLDRDRHSMLVRTAYVQDILTPHSKISYIDVCWYIHTGEVADMDRTVCVWKRTGHKSSFVVLTHISVKF